MKQKSSRSESRNSLNIKTGSSQSIQEVYEFNYLYSAMMDEANTMGQKYGHSKSMDPKDRRTNGRYETAK